MINYIPSPDEAPASPDASLAQARAIKQWARHCLGLDDEAVITVSEVMCNDPACPGLETIIAVFDADGARRWKFEQPKAELTIAMVHQTLATLPLPQNAPAPAVHPHASAAANAPTLKPTI